MKKFDILRKEVPMEPYSFGVRRKRLFDIKKEVGETFSLNGKTYICDGFLPKGNPDGEGIFATEIV